MYRGSWGLLLGKAGVPLAHNLFCIVAELISGSRWAVEVGGGVFGGWPNGLRALEAGGGMWEGWPNELGAATVLTRNEVKSPSSRRV